MNEVTEEEIFRVWTGKKDEFYNKINSKKFNWCMFFFSTGYLFYRRMYLIAVIYYILSNIIFRIAIYNFGLLASIIVSLGISIAMGFAFYPLYKWNFKRRINKYKTKKGYSNEELLTIAKEKGGTSWTIILLIVIPTTILLVILFFAITIQIALGTNGIFTQSKKVAEEYEKHNNTNISLIGENIINNSTNKDNFSDSLTSNYGTITLGTSGYSMRYDKNKWKEDYYSYNEKVLKLSDNSAILAFANSEKCNKNEADFSKYDDIVDLKDEIIKTLKSSLSSTGAEIKNNNAFILTSNDNYYFYIDLSKDGKYQRNYVVFDKDKNIMFGFALITQDSYINSSLNNEVVNMITNL